ncbi:MAG: sigma-70 family RNA polymerase sigma factor [Myxococcales bacterium]|nr:sigma-70 family RNA polymerase sigma factor [Myxococcales bacterium]
MPVTPGLATPPADDPAYLAAEEARLIERLIARDEVAFGILVRTYERRIFALLVRMIGNRAEAEELAQEVFVQVFKAIGSFRGESRLSTWIYRIALNLSKNRSKYLRVRQTGKQASLDGLEEKVSLGGASGGGPSGAFGTSGALERPDEAMAGRQLEVIVREAILQLDPAFRECLVLRDIEDLSYEEIEGITGLPQGTVKSRIHRARTQLKELVERALGEKIT